MKKSRLVLPALLVSLLALTGCGSGYGGYFGSDSNGSEDTRETVSMKWYSTERGDVSCTDIPLPYQKKYHDCDWATLEQRPEDAEVAGELRSQWVLTDSGEVWCIVTPTSHQGNTTSCDWETLGKRVNSGRLPVM